MYDETDVEDVDTAGEDHIYDELRYVCMKNPIAPRIPAERKAMSYDPLDIGGVGKEYDRYEFFRRY